MARPVFAAVVVSLMALCTCARAADAGSPAGDLSPSGRRLDLPALMEGVSVPLRPRHACAAATPSAVRNLVEKFDAKYIDGLVQTTSNISVVRQPRLRCTALLTKASLATVPGDIVETGVFKGGTLSLMLRAVVDHDVCGRKVWAFDSFQGLPPIHPEDSRAGDGIEGQAGTFKSPRDEFEGNVKKVMGASDFSARLVVTAGWFNETLARAPIDSIAFLRLDGDLYVSTMQALEALYDKVVPGGFVYVDDYLSFRGCKRAVDQFRTRRRIYEPMHVVLEPDGRIEAVWWRKL